MRQGVTDVAPSRKKDHHARAARSVGRDGGKRGVGPLRIRAPSPLPLPHLPLADQLERSQRAKDAKGLEVLEAARFLGREQRAGGRKLDGLRDDTLRRASDHDPTSR